MTGVSVMRDWRLVRRTATVVAGPLAAGAAAGLIVACGSAPGGRVVPGAMARLARPSATATPRTVPYDLYTHCGIDYARVANRYYAATPPLSDGSGNPPPGWGNPYQQGTVTVVSPATVIFTDKAGHRVVFTLVAPGPARTMARVCS